MQFAGVSPPYSLFANPTRLHVTQEPSQAGNNTCVWQILLLAWAAPHSWLGLEDQSKRLIHHFQLGSIFPCLKWEDIPEACEAWDFTRATYYARSHTFCAAFGPEQCCFRPLGLHAKWQHAPPPPSSLLGRKQWWTKTVTRGEPVFLKEQGGDTPSPGLKNSVIVPIYIKALFFVDF